MNSHNFTRGEIAVYPGKSEATNCILCGLGEPKAVTLKGRLNSQSPDVVHAISGQKLLLSIDTDNKDKIVSGHLRTSPKAAMTSGAHADICGASSPHMSPHSAPYTASASSKSSCSGSTPAEGVHDSKQDAALYQIVQHISRVGHPATIHSALGTKIQGGSCENHSYMHLLLCAPLAGLGEGDADSCNRRGMNTTYTISQYED